MPTGGLPQILGALGHPDGARERRALVAVFVAATLAAVAGGEAVLRASSLPFVAGHAGLWLAWLTWHSVAFPRARRRRLRGDGAGAYRAVFGRHIVPGVSIGVALMGLPALHALAVGAPAAPAARLAASAACLAAGVALLSWAFATIGFASAGFLYEYVEARRPIAIRGIYRHVRHPLFLGGVVASVGAALAFDGGSGLVPALVNLAVLPAYRVLEDRRLSGVFGAGYDAYRRDVAAFFPAPAMLASGRAALRRTATAVSKP
jgi:protein-S-isoprenylcysteine O-methyltransferase Ste14